MSFYDGFCDVESQADAGVLAARFITHAVETFKDVVEVFRTDADAFVYDADAILIIIFFQADDDMSPMWRIFDSVVQDITNNLSDACLIGDNSGIKRLYVEVDGMLFRAGLCRTHATGEYINQIEAGVGEV